MEKRFRTAISELVEAYWKRMRHLESRRMMVEEQTAEPLTEEEIATIARPAQLSYIAQARYELPAMLQDQERTQPGHCKFYHIAT